VEIARTAGFLPTSYDRRELYNYTVNDVDVLSTPPVISSQQPSLHSSALVTRNLMSPSTSALNNSNPKFQSMDDMSFLSPTKTPSSLHSSKLAGLGLSSESNALCKSENQQNSNHFTPPVTSMQLFREEYMCDESVSRKNLYSGIVNKPESPAEKLLKQLGSSSMPSRMPTFGDYICPLNDTMSDELQVDQITIHTSIFSLPANKT
jgi:hypothetical protein